MNENQLKSIKVTIAGRAYPMKVKESEVQMMEWIVREVNTKIKDFQLTYTQRDIQDCIVMALITYAVDFHQKEVSDGIFDTQKIEHKISTIHSLLDQMLHAPKQ